MYSPKINEELIPRLYRIAKKEGIPMTKLVDGIIREALGNAYSTEEERSEVK